MSAKGITIASFEARYTNAVLGLFDANAPAAFHPGERPALERYLEEDGASYRLLLDEGAVAAGFGLKEEVLGRARVGWFMADPSCHGQGLGRLMMEAVEAEAKARRYLVIDIAASHLSEGFYQRFGARSMGQVENGWGEGMHRVDMIWMP